MFIYTLKDLKDDSSLTHSQSSTFVFSKISKSVSKTFSFPSKLKANVIYRN